MSGSADGVSTIWSYGVNSTSSTPSWARLGDPIPSSTFSKFPLVPTGDTLLAFGTSTSTGAGAVNADTVFAWNAGCPAGWTGSSALQSCGAFAWHVDSWSICSKTCGIGTRTATLSCRSPAGDVIAVSNCTSAVKPATQENCNVQACGNITIYRSVCIYHAYKPTHVQFAVLCFIVHLYFHVPGLYGH